MIQPTGCRRDGTPVKAAIAERHADHLAESVEPDGLEYELSLHEALLVSRTRVFVPRPDVEERLTRYGDGTEAVALALAEPPGSGKNPVLARWIDARQRGAAKR